MTDSRAKTKITAAILRTSSLEGNHTEADVDGGTKAGTNNYPNPGPNTIEAKEGHAFPGFTEDLYFLHDVAVVILAKPYNLPASQYGRLPSLNQLDGLQNGANTTFTAVGYGVQEIRPK